MRVVQPDIRILHAGDEPMLERYLASRPDTTLFFQNNLREVGGLDADPTQPYGGVYAAAIEGDEILGIVAHFWNGNGAFEADAWQVELLRAALRESGRPLRGLVGPAAHVAAARDGLGLGEAPATMDSIEDLFALRVDALRVPDMLTSEAAACRRATAADLELLTDWRTAYSVEALGVTDSDETRAQAREGLERGLPRGHTFVLETEGRPVSMSGFNAWTGVCAQIGGVYTPPALRSRGYGRAVVAGSLLLAAPLGIQRSVLFTGHDNVPAQRSYRALGYERIGDYALVLFRDPQDIP